MRGLVRHRRDDRHRCRAGSDHDDLLARIVKIFGPELRMDDLALEILSASEIGVERLVIIVVTRAEVEPCLLYTSPSPRDRTRYRMPSSA